ncbi:MAG: HEPN domain-containing protein [bacterium]|nr:HEPN domain-containing protein [bacterium]
MNSRQDTDYRLKLARNHLKSAREDISLKRWPEAFRHSQLCAENSGKAIIAMFKPVKKTYETMRQLSRLIKENLIPEEIKAELVGKLHLFGKMGMREHILADYGDEMSYQTPWEIIGEDKAKEALEVAEKCFVTAEAMFGKIYVEEEMK